MLKEKESERIHPFRITNWRKEIDKLTRKIQRDRHSFPESKSERRGSLSLSGRAVGFASAETFTLSSSTASC